MTASTTTVTMRPIASGFSPAAAVVVVTIGSNSARHAARLVMPRCTTVTMTISAPTRARGLAGEETSEPRRCGGRGQRAGQRQRCSHRQDELPRQARLEVFPPEDADARRDEQ